MQFLFLLLWNHCFQRIRQRASYCRSPARKVPTSKHHHSRQTISMPGSASFMKTFQFCRLALTDQPSDQQRNQLNIIIQRICEYTEHFVYKSMTHILHTMWIIMKIVGSRGELRISNGGLFSKMAGMKIS